MFAERIKELRKEKGITQVELAEAIGLSKGTVAMWEVGKREANFETLDKLADYFGKSVDYILGRSDDGSKNACEEDMVNRMIDIQSTETVIRNIKEYLKLDNYGMKAVQAVISMEYSRCVEMDSLTDLFSHIEVTKGR